MKLNERIKTVRSHYGLSLRAFGERIGISAPSVAKLESGENNPREQTIRAICSEFSVRRDWLETGEEPMLFERDEDDVLIDTILSDSSDFVRAVIRGITRTPGGWEKLREMMLAIQHELDAQQKEPEE